MQKQQPKNVKALWTDLKSYLEIRVEILKLSLIERGSKLVADLITNTIVLICLLMAFLASAVTLAFYLSHLLNSYTRGFGCACLFFTLLAMLLMWKKAVVERFIAGAAIRRYFQKHYEEMEEEDALCNEEPIVSGHDA